MFFYSCYYNWRMGRGYYSDTEMKGHYIQVFYQIKIYLYFQLCVIQHIQKLNNKRFFCFSLILLSMFTVILQNYKANKKNV